MKRKAASQSLTALAMSLAELVDTITTDIHLTTLNASPAQKVKVLNSTQSTKMEPVNAESQEYRLAMSMKAIPKPSQTASATTPAEPAVGTMTSQMVSTIASTASMVLSFTTYILTEPEDAESQELRLATKM
jgi:hypothetical protein